MRTLFGQFDWGVAGWGTAIATVLGAAGIFIWRERSSRAALRQAKADARKTEAEADKVESATATAKDKADFKTREQYVDHIIEKWEELYGTAIEREKNCQMELVSVRTELAEQKKTHEEDMKTLRERMERAGV